MSSVVLQAKAFDRAAAQHFKRWTPRSLQAVRACLVDGERLSVVAKAHDMKPQTLVNARLRFLKRYYAERQVKVDADTFIKRYTPDGAAALKPFTKGLRRLVASGYSTPQIQAYLKLNGITLPSPTVRAFLRRLSR